LSGWADAAIPAGDSIDYFEAVGRKLGEQRRNAFARLYLVPGMQHCAGGTIATDTFDSLGEMERWLDTGRAPDRIEAAKLTSGVVTRTRPLCAHPNVAKYRPPGSAASTWNINDSFYFGCVDPSTGKAVEAKTPQE